MPLVLLLVGLFGWIDSVPLYGPVDEALTGAGFGSLVLRFLAAHALGLIAWGYLLDRRPQWARSGLRTALLILAGLQGLLLLAPALATTLFVVMGAVAGVVVAWGRWYATTVTAGLLGRVFAAGAAGVMALRWIFGALIGMLPLPLLYALAFLPLVLAWLALDHLTAAPGAAPGQSTGFQSVSLREPLSPWAAAQYGLFIVFFSVVAGLSFRYIIITPVSPLMADSLRGLPYVAAVLLAGVLADRMGLKTVVTLGSGLLALAFLIGAFGEASGQYVSLVLNGAAFGFLEPAPWLLLAAGARSETAGRWFGWGLNLNVVPIFIGAAITLPNNAVTPAGFGVLATTALVLAVIALQGAPNLAAPQRQEESEVPVAEGSGGKRSVPPARELVTTYFGSELTGRELEIAQLAALGQSTREIAGQLFLSENTVKTHLRSVYRKTGTANRNDLYRKLMALAGVEHELLAEDEA